MSYGLELYSPQGGLRYTSDHPFLNVVGQFLMPIGNPLDWEYNPTPDEPDSVRYIYTALVTGSPNQHAIATVGLTNNDRFIEVKLAPGAIRVLSHLPPDSPVLITVFSL